MNRNRILSLILVAGTLSPAILSADIPASIHYQGKVTVDGEPFDGVGQFKFAIVDDGEGELEQATAEATVNSGFVTNIEVLNPGFGYSEPPSVSIVDSERSGFGASATAVVEDGQVVEINVDNAGSNYTEAIVHIAACTIIQTAMIIIMRFSVREIRPSGTLPSPPTQAHLRSRFSI